MAGIRNYCSSSAFPLRSEADKMLVLSMGFSILLTLVRMVYTEQLTFIFLVWNLFLAYLPYRLSAAMLQKPSLIANRWVCVLAGITWLLFIPNSFYLVTDLFHLGYHRGVPLWFDLVLIVSFAWNGLLLGIFSVRHMEKMVQQMWSQKNELLFIYPVMLLNAVGVYIGRYLRFNSWDVITNPWALIGEMVALFLHPVASLYAWGMIGCFSVLMTLLYLTIKRMITTPVAG